VLIGYQHLYQPQTRRLKAALLGGAIGRIDRASVLACWPRADSYYARNDWAGALKRGGRWVLDSPANNALAHMLNLSLFLLGDTPDTPADIERVEAELYRANPIENYDTCALRATLAGRKRLTIFMTHACAQRDGPHITIDGDAGGATWSSEHGMTIGDEAFAVNFGERRSMLKAWRSVLEGEALPGDVGHLATPAAVRAQTVLVNAASAGTVVHDFDADAVAVEEGVKHVPGIEAELEACHREGRLPSERGATWARPAGTIEVGPAFAFTGIPG
jgi:predicted dehydrogenase